MIILPESSGFHLDLNPFLWQKSLDPDFIYVKGQGAFRSIPCPEWKRGYQQH